MATTRSASTIFLRKLLREKGGGTEGRFLEKLKPEERQLYQTLLPVTRVPLATFDRFITLGAAVLFPDDPAGQRKFGRAMARDNLTGLYRFLAQIMTVPFLIKQVAAIWRNYYDQGQARAEKDPECNLGKIIVTDFPDMPACVLELSAGFMEGALEMTGAKSIRVSVDSSDRTAWAWSVTWE